MRNGCGFGLLMGCLACTSEPDQTLLQDTDAGSLLDSDAGHSGSPTEPSVRVVIGGGQLEFEPLTSGASVPLIAGFQGAHHVWISLGLDGFGEGNLQMHLSTRWLAVADSVREVSGRIAQRPPQDSGFDSVVLGWPALLYQAQCSHQQQVEVAVEIWDESSNERAFDALRVVVDVPMEERLESCD